MPVELYSLGIRRRKRKHCGERFVLDVIEVRLKGRLGLVIGLDRKRNALGNLKIRLLAHRLHMRHELSGKTLRNQLRSKGGFKTDDNRTFRSYHKTSLGRTRDKHVVCRYRETFAVERNRLGGGDCGGNTETGPLWE